MERLAGAYHESREHPGPQKMFRNLDLGPDQKTARGQIDACTEDGDFSFDDPIGIGQKFRLDCLAKTERWNFALRHMSSSTWLRYRQPKMVPARVISYAFASSISGLPSTGRLAERAFWQTGTERRMKLISFFKRQGGILLQ
jgi:hypothetical protein